MAHPYLQANKFYTKKPDLNMFKMHSHDDYELYCFLNGSARYFVEGSVYHLSPEDILIMKRAESHSLIIDKASPYERIVVSFNADALVGNTAEKIITFIDNRPLGRFNKYSKSFSKEKHLVFYLEKLCESSNFEERRLYLTLVLNELCKSYPSEHEIIEEEFKSIVDYINDNLFEQLSLEDIASKFNLSKNHINRKFKEYTGSTIWAYVKTKRLIYSKNLLKNGEKPTNVYLKCGFNDYVSFYKAYKQKYGVSPKDDIIQKKQ